MFGFSPDTGSGIADNQLTRTESVQSIKKEGTFILEGAKQATVRQVFTRWGWKENNDPTSAKCDVKWVCSRKLLEGPKVSTSSRQLVNHFRGSDFIDNKNSLAQCLYRCTACADRFFPRQYDLSNAQTLKEFLGDYIETQAWVKEADRSESKTVDAPADAVAASQAARIAASVLERRATSSSIPVLLCAHECESLLGPGCHLPAKHQLMLRPFVDAFTSQASASPSQCPVCGDQDATRSRSKGPVCGDKDATRSRSKDVNSSELRCRQQPMMHGPANAWVVKEPCMSLSRGVSVHRGVRSVLTEADRCRWGCVAQKYIEQPLLVRGAKTDLRLWVCILDWNPLTVLVNSTPYFRVANHPWTFEGDGQADAFAHQTNCFSTDPRETLRTFLGHFGPEASERWAKHSWPLMLDAVRAVAFACRDAVLGSEWEKLKMKPTGDAAGPRCFELIGFDFALDREWNPWLLEGNIYPDISGKVGETENESDATELAAWVDDAIESLLNMVLQHSVQKLGLPKPSELEQRVVPEGFDEVSRLFPKCCLDEKNHSASCCYGGDVAGVPPCLVQGLDLQPPCGRWQLVLRERKLEVMSIWKSYQMQQSRVGSGMTEGMNHSKVMRECLLPVAKKKPKAIRQDSKQAAASYPNVKRSKSADSLALCGVSAVSRPLLINGRTSSKKSVTPPVSPLPDAAEPRSDNLTPCRLSAVSRPVLARDTSGSTMQSITGRAPSKESDSSIRMLVREARPKRRSISLSILNPTPGRQGQQGRNTGLPSSLLASRH